MDRDTVLKAGVALALGLTLAACGGDADGAERPGDAAAVAADSGAAAATPSEAPTPQRPTMSLEDLGYDRGSADAPVLVLEFSDFGCPYCARFALQNLPQIQQEFIDNGSVRWKYVPFVIGMFPNGGEAARAAECAAEQDESHFWAMHDQLYRDQQDWKKEHDPRDRFVRYARDLDLDRDAFATCYDSDAVADRINVNNLLAARLGVRSTPTFFINGVRVLGALPMEHFRLLLRGAATQPGDAGGN